MRASFRSFSSSIFVLFGTGALLVLIVVSITGGFVLDAGPLHFSARHLTGPIVLTLLA